MKKFYLCSGNIPKGPYRVEELLQQGIKETDLIWCEGFSKCELAVDIFELKNAFKSPAKNRPLGIKHSYSVNEDLKTIYPANNIDSKYITLLGWAVFFTVILVIYYCINQFL